MQVARVVRHALGKNVTKRNYHPPPHFRVTTYNDLPTPQGNWQTHYDAQQKKYNAHLLFGVAFCIGSIIIAKSSGLLYLNYYPPERPADKNDYQ